MKQKLAMMLAVISLVISMSTVSYAAEGGTKAAAQARAAGNSGGIQPYYIYISNIAAGLKIEGNTAYCLSEVFAKKVCFVNLTMRLQRKENGSWQTKSSWVESSTSGSKTMSKSFTLSSRGTYRVYAIATVEGEQVTCESNIVTY
ncbi:MAG: hypothetical protein HFH42_00125 [Lachnospiraceae bacterium]|nr:hypothetical protein [Lachnospiraceae bacterium]